VKRSILNFFYKKFSKSVPSSSPPGLEVHDSDNEDQEEFEAEVVDESTPHGSGPRLPKGPLATFLDKFKKDFFSKLDGFEER
jgi:hypothetical protein